MIVLTDEWTKASLARAVPGSYWDPDRRAWVLENPTPRSAATALKLFPSLNLQAPELVKLRDQLNSDLRPFDNATPYNKRIAAPRVQAVLDGLGWKLHDYQAIDMGYIADILRAHGGAYVAHDRGLGKTLQTCTLIDNLDAQRTLVICPNTAKETVWAAELRRFCPWLEVVVMPNSKPKRLRTLVQVQDLAREGRPFALVTHYESLAVVAGKKGKKLDDGWKRLGIEWDLAVADEGHRLQSPDALMTKAAKKIPSKMRVVLSGSVIQNRLEEMYGPLSWLFPKTYTSRWASWNNRFLEYVDSAYARVCIGVKHDKIDALRNELGVYTVYRRKEDELQLPDLTEQDLLIDLTSGQRKVYDELVQTCLARLDDGTPVKATEGVAMLTKLRQIATGLDLLGDVKDSSKLDLATEMILDNPDTDWLVFGWYRASLKALVDRLATAGVDAWLVTGETKHEDRAAAVAGFQNGTKRVFCGSISTLGESVNLQRANNVLYLDQSWNPASNLQARDRAYRQGQTRPVTVTRLVARGTVDELRVLPSLANKEALRAAILGS